MKFELQSKITVSAHTTVEAETLEAAIEIAQRRSVEIGGISSGVCPDKVWAIEDADGEAQDIEEAA